MSVEIPASNWWVFRDHPVSYGEAIEEGLYRGFGLPTVDGDTPAGLLDSGFFGNPHLLPLRLVGVDTEETRGTEGEVYELARAAMERTSELTKGRPILVEGSDEMSFRRGVAEVYVVYGGLPADTRTSVTAYHNLGGHEWAALSEILLAEDLAEPYREG